MKEQYVGDVNDYRKYALLRALSGDGDLSTGVCWMLTPPDNRKDGNKVQYLDDPKRWRHHDPLVFEKLQQARCSPCGDNQRLSHIERRGILRNARYFNDYLYDSKEDRKRYFRAMHEQFRDVELVYFDPDNGTEVTSMPKGRRGSSKYIFIDEIRSTFEQGRSVLIYQHFPRKERLGFIKDSKSKLADIAPENQVHAFATSHVLFLLLVHDRQSHRLSRAVQSIGSKWPANFLALR